MSESRTAPLWISDAVAAELLPLAEAIDVLADAHRAYLEGRAGNMARAHLRWEGSILHAVGGVLDQYAGTKTWLYTPGGAKPLLILFSLRDGSVAAAVEAFGMGKNRTAATSGLATRVMARSDATTLALLGTGSQAFAQAQAVAAVRDLTEIRLFGRDAGRREGLAERLRAELGVAVTPCGSAEEAVADADVVTTVTRSSEPFLSGAALRSGMHVNAVGAIVPTRRELDVSAVARFGRIAVDSVPQAEADAGELIAAVAAGELAWEAVAELGAVVAEAPPRDPAELTLFKSLGVGIADVAIGVELLRRARSAGAGEPLPGSVSERYQADTPEPQAIVSNQ
ncbi:MAG: ornithine cyclodeaminase family protein [Actinobacteria bacterium]|nr:ornithine cyclodeaminase family protein [Actinomycetota bacterium]